MEVIRNLSDTELLDNLRSGKMMDESIRYIYRNYFETLSWYVMNNNGSRQDAEDIFQDTVVSFIDMVQKDKFREEASVKTFLYTINRHAWLNELKRRGRASFREEKFERSKEEMPDLSHAIMERESNKQVTDLVDKLGDTCKKILLAFYYDNLSMKEILVTLHYENEQVVRNKKYKCLKQLEQMLEGKPGLKQNLKKLLHG